MLLGEFQQFADGRDVLDDLAGLGADADVAEVRKFVFVLVAVVGHVGQGLHHPGYVDFGIFRQIREAAHCGNVFAPAGELLVHRLEAPAVVVVAGDVVNRVSVGILVGGANLKFAVPVAGIGEGVELVQYEILIAAVAEGIAFFHCVVPANHALASGGGTELDFAQLLAERVVELDFGDEDVGADFGVVGLAAADVVDRLCGDAGRLEEFRRKGVGGGDVGREAVAFVEPVGLAKLADNVVALVLLAEDELAHIDDLRCERLSGGPVGFDQRFDVEGEGAGSGELAEVKFGFGESSAFDDFGVGAGFGAGQRLEKSGPAIRGDLADVLDDAQRALGSLTEFLGEDFFVAEEIGVINLELADLVEIGGCDAAAGGAAGIFFQHVDTVVFPREVEQAVAEVGDQATLVDGEALECDMAVFLRISDFPQELARVGDNAATDGQVRDVWIRDATGQEVELEPGYGVARVGTAVDFYDGGDGVLAAGDVAQLVDDLEDDAAFAFVPGGDAGVGDELGSKWSEHFIK